MSLTRWGREIGEPWSWVLGIIASVIAIVKIYNLFDLRVYVSGTFIGIITGFVLHELAHRNIAKKYGLKTEFTAYTPGLLLTVLSGFLPNIILLVPGYVKTVVYKYTPNLERIFFYSVAAGPATNIALALVARIASLAMPHAGVQAFLIDFSTINGWIAFFNLLPIPPLDGSKMFSLNKPVWIAMILLAFFLAFL